MANKAYIRVSTDQQDLEHQKYTILECANRENLRIDEWIEVTMSTRKSEKARRIEELLSNLQPGDRVFVSELSRLGRSLQDVITLLNVLLIDKGVRLTVIKNNLDLYGKQDLNTKVMTTMLALFAEIERDLISIRTKQALASVRARGQKLGRPKQPGKSRLDGKEMEIRNLLEHGVAKSAIARIYHISRTGLLNFIRQRMS